MVPAARDNPAPAAVLDVGPGVYASWLARLGYQVRLVDPVPLLEALLAIEGPGWLFEGRWADPAQRPGILRAIRAVEREPSLLGQSSHLLVVARRRG